MQQKKKQQIADGYYIKARKIQQSDIAHCSPATREIWDWLLMNANHKESENGSIKRGQLFRSLKEIREGLKWYVGYRTERYSEDVTKKAMKALRKHLMITSMKAPGGVLITICNYSFYQNPENYESTNGSTNEGTTKAPLRHQGGTIYNNKNEKNEKNKNKKNKDYAPKTARTKDIWKNSKDLMTVDQFIEFGLKDKRRHINIIAEYADEQKMDFKTKGQWHEFITRNVRYATRLAVFDDGQLSTAMKQVKSAGYIEKYTLETLHKFLVK